MPIRRIAELSRQGGSSAADLARKIAAMRSDAFELVGELRASSRWGESRELESAGDQLQSIANQLADVQARLPVVSTSRPTARSGGRGSRAA